MDKKGVKILPALIAGAASALLGGCIDVEQSLSLRRDLSGTAGFSMTVDLDPMFVFAATMQHGLAGKAGDPTPEEIDALRRDFLAKQKAEDPSRKQQEAASQKEQLAKSLPAGLELQAATIEEQGTKIATRLQFAFDDVAKLAHIKLPENGQAQPGANPYSDPFSALKVVDEGPTILVTLGNVDAVARIREQAAAPAKDGADQEMPKALEAALKSMRFAFRLDTPFEVVETNATRRDGSTLYWEFKATDPKAEAPPMMTARLRK
jgi:hypothetical protein